MSRKGTKLSAESKAAISKANRELAQKRKCQLELSLEGSRIYIRALGNSAVSVKIDVTPLWFFFKDALSFRGEV
jgi:hypothetical protein